MEIRPMTIEDYSEIYSMWEITTRRALDSSDSRENIERYLKRNPGMSMVAVEDGKIVVVADACHSGGGTAAFATQDTTQYIKRGAGDAFVIPDSKIQYDPRKSNNIDWVFISACKSYQCNYEYKGNGSLTYCILQVADIMTELSYTQLQSELKRHINKIIPYPQTPQVEVPERRNTVPVF